MTKTQTTPGDAPSMRTLGVATAVALVAAAVVLVAFVLPSEYGIDPLRTGHALGLTDLASASAEPRRIGGVERNSTSRAISRRRR